MLYARGEAPVRLFRAAAIIPVMLVGRMDAVSHRKTGCFLGGYLAASE